MAVTWGRSALARGIVLLILSLGAVGCGAPPQRPPAGAKPGIDYLEDRLGHEVRRVIDEHDLASVSLTIVDGQGIVYERSFGWADEDRGVQATPLTPYRWGSNSKVFVMLALLQLEAEGKLDLDAPLSEYLPEFSIGPPPPTHPESADWALRDITLRSVLTHHSGLPNDYLRGFLSEAPIPLRQYLPAVREMRAQQPVGISHSYSNLGYSLLGLVIERVSGQSLHDYMQTHMFLPTGMESAAFRWTPELKRQVARPYDGEGRERPLFEISSKPAGALVASTRDMGRFATAIIRGGEGRRGRFIDRELLESSFVRQNVGVPLDFDLKQALAWRLDARPVETFGRSIQHGGGILSHHSAFVILRDHELGALVATNSERGAQVVQQLAWQALSLAIEVKTGKPPPPGPMPLPVHEMDDPTEDMFEGWTGHFATVLGDVTVERRDEQELSLEVFQRRLFLRPVEEGGMGLWEKLFGLWDIQPKTMKLQRISLQNVAGRQAVVQESPFGRQLLGIAYTPLPADERWAERVGFYRHPQRPRDHYFLHGLEILLAPEGHLLLRPIVDLPIGGPPPSSALHPVDSEWAVTEGLGRNKSAWIRIDEEGLLHFNGLTMRLNPDEPERCYGRPRAGARFKGRTDLCH